MQRKPTSTFTMFQPQVSHQAQRALFATAINTFFAMLGQNLKAFHLSEVIREMGNFYLAGMKRHHLPDRPTSIHFMCFRLLEKAMMLEPQSENADKNYHALLTVVPMLSHDKGIFNDELRNSRLQAYQDRLRSAGALVFFNETLTDHLDDLALAYPGDFSTILHHVLDYLTQTTSYQYVVAKYLDSNQQAVLHQVFENAKNNLMSGDHPDINYSDTRRPSK